MAQDYGSSRWLMAGTRITEPVVTPEVRYGIILRMAIEVIVE